MTTVWQNNITDEPAIFAGRHDDLEVDAKIVRESLPRAVVGLAPSHWIVADPWTFPGDYLTEAQWDAPLDVVLASGLPTDRFVGQLHRPILSRLTAFDTVVATESTWRALAERYSWPSSMWERPMGRLPAVVRNLLRRARVVEQIKAELGDESAYQIARWDVRTRANKARFRAEAAALEPLIATAADRCPQGTNLVALELGTDTGRYIGMLRMAGAAVIAHRRDSHLADHLRFNHANVDVRIARPESIAPPETVDLALVSIDVTAIESSERALLLRASWEAVRVGGIFTVLQRFGPGHTVSDLVAMIAQASCASAELNDLRSIRNTENGRVDGAILSFSKIGVPTTW